MEKLLTIKEVASVLGCSTTTINRQVQDGTMTTPIRVGQRVTFPRSEVEALLTARIKGATTDEIHALAAELVAKRTDA